MNEAANCVRLQPEAIAGSERLTVSPWRAGDWVLLLDGKIVATYTTRMAAMPATLES